MIEIRYMKLEDKEFWYQLDKHLPKCEYPHKVRDKRGYVLLADGKPFGLLRYNLFWDNTPFCTLLYIADGHHKKGYGRALMAHWEADMQSQGYNSVLTSTQTDEQAQHFYRKLGYRDCGGLVIGDGEPMELFMIKSI